LCVPKCHRKPMLMPNVLYFAVERITSLSLSQPSSTLIRNCSVSKYSRTTLFLTRPRCKRCNLFISSFDSVILFFLNKTLMERCINYPNLLNF